MLTTLRAEQSGVTRVRAPSAGPDSASAPTRRFHLPAELTAGFERDAGRISMRLTKSPNEQTADIMNDVAGRFADAAGDKKAFHALMAKVYGKDYDAKEAESFRQKALAGDFTWLPKVSFVDSSVLEGAHGAYDKEGNTILLNKNLLADPKLAAQVYSEELGHFLDTKLRSTDSKGDEGELFRRLLSGENLSSAQVAAIRAENDHGVITVDGKQVQVEFWNPFKAVGKAVKKAVKSVGKAVSGVAKGVSSVVGGVFDGVKTSVSGLFDGVTGFAGNLLKGKVGAAFDSLIAGADRAFIQGPTRMLEGALDGIGHLLDAPTHLLGPLGKPLRWITTRAWEGTRGLITGAWDATTNIVRNGIEGGRQIAGGFGKILTGDFSGGFADIGKGLLKATVQSAADGLLLIGGRALSAIQMMLGLEPPGRKLTQEEIAILRPVYGDSIDYDAVRIKQGDAGLFSTNSRPFAHGNNVYMKDKKITPEVLIHEMAHVWQHQNGGPDYMLEALYSQEHGKGYDWKQSVPQTRWEDLEPEQQAEFLGDLGESGYFDRSSPNYLHFEADLNGDDIPEDLTRYARDVLTKVQAGIGAP